MTTEMVNIDNSSMSPWEEGDNGPPLHTRLAFASAWILIAVAGIIGRRRYCSFEDIHQRIFPGNCLVIFVAVRFQKMSNVTNCFIVNRK